MLIAIEAGILITDDVTRLDAGTPKLIYAARTDPAMVEKPDVMVKSVRWVSMCPRIRLA